MAEEPTYSAKQVASRIGTDAKTLRKFFRSKAWPETAVGQGARYEFPQSRLEEIRKAFNHWQKNKRYPAKTTSTSPLSPAVEKTFQKIERRERRGVEFSEVGRRLMERFPLIPGESVAARTKRVGAILSQERIAEGRCPSCIHPIDEHWESPYMQKLRPRSARNKTGCSHPGCWCQKLPEIALKNNTVDENGD